ncbi:MAG: hypothetical protein OEZ43_13495 [Gammaproteobacteria bacterium]|nr:hypothetical protein [Gammaproteobacteria bacterium]
MKIFNHYSVQIKLAIAALGMVFTLIWAEVAYSGDKFVEDKWRFPSEQDIKWDWLEYKNILPEPYHAAGDFNGDGKVDDAWILIDKENENYWSLIVFLSTDGDKKRLVKLEESNAKVPAQAYGIVVKPPGSYKVACEKGHVSLNNCKNGNILTKNTSINLFRFESSSSIFFWEEKSASFLRFWESD